MAPKEGSAEALVLEFIQQQNRPVNAQNVADAMQKHGLKKAAIQKALDVLAVESSTGAQGALSEGGAAASAPTGAASSVIFKDYGKQRIYMSRQDNLEVLSAEQMEQLRGRIAAAQEEAKDLREQCGALEKARGALESSLTLPQIQEQIRQLTEENTEMESKLQTLKSASGAVSTEDRRHVDDKYGEYVGLWRKRKRIFMALWDTVTENFPRSLKDFKEELGVEMDEDAGCSLADFEPKQVMHVGRSFVGHASFKRKAPADAHKPSGNNCPEGGVGGKQAGNTKSATAVKKSKPVKNRK